MAGIRMGIDAVPHPHREAVQQYSDLLRSLGGDNVLALTLFGAVAAGVFEENRHTIRNVLVLGSMDLEMLRRLAEQGIRLGKARIAAPLAMTPEYIRQSLDSFPLELLEIQQNHATVFGDDYFEDLTFEAGYVRLQCERELKTNLIRLRQSLLAAAGRDDVLAAAQTDIGEGLMRTFRGLLWLKGVREAKPANEVIAAVEQLIQRGLPGIQGARDPGGERGWRTFEPLYRDVESLSEIVNAW